MRAAEALLRTMVSSGVDVCFMNPGTSEMHFVAALDDVPEMRGVLTLFEGVATGAADGYARMAGGPAAALLHLGPGLGNGIANLHNARRARTPLLAVVGDHATYHKRYDAPLESDIEALASNVSKWVARPSHPSSLPTAAAEAVAAARSAPGGVSTLILPADVSWGTSDGGGFPRLPPDDALTFDNAAVDEVASLLRSGRPVAFLVGGRACRAAPLGLLGRVAASTGARIITETFPARLERGAGVVPAERLAYLGEMALEQLSGVSDLVLVDAALPVSFFAYPEKPSVLVPDGCSVHTLCGPADDAVGAVSALVSALSPASVAAVAALERPAPPMGALTAQALGAAVGAALPEGAVVCDESNTAGLWIQAATAGCPPHDWLALTGGSIGIGLPLAVGAAVACPDRRVVALEADGSAMYTLQALWTMAREQLDVTVVVVSNRSYAILNMELQRVGASAGGSRARRMLDLSGPDLDFASLARGMGVPAVRAETAEDLHAALSGFVREPGPALVEAVVTR